MKQKQLEKKCEICKKPFTPDGRRRYTCNAICSKIRSRNKIKMKQKENKNKNYEDIELFEDYYCVVIPFTNKEDYLESIDKIKKTRTDQFDNKKKWWVDGMIIDREDYIRLLKKSKSIEIINNLEEDD